MKRQVLHLLEQARRLGGKALPKATQEHLNAAIHSLRADLCREALKGKSK